MNTAETFTVTVTSETDASGEVVTLTETGVSNGVFLGSVGSELGLTNGDIVTATYIDPANDFSVEQTRQMKPITMTWLSGSYTENTTWTVAESPYLVTGDVDFSQNVSLTIEPGVEVVFLALSDDQNGGQDQFRSEVHVRGNFVAAGTAQDSIIIRSSRDVSQAGDYYGFRFEQGEISTIDISYCRVEGYYLAFCNQKCIWC